MWYSRGDNYYEPMIWWSFFSTGVFLFLVLLVVAGLMRSKIDYVSPKALYYYVMSFSSLIFVASALALLVTVLADIILAQFTHAINLVAVKRAIVQCLSTLIVAGPCYVFHWRAINRGFGVDSGEQIIWFYYKYAILGYSGVGAVLLIGAFFHQVLGGAVGLNAINWESCVALFGYGIIGFLVWFSHYRKHLFN